MTTEPQIIRRSNSNVVQATVRKGAASFEAKDASKRSAVLLRRFATAAAAVAAAAGPPLIIIVFIG